MKNQQLVSYYTCTYTADRLYFPYSYCYSRTSQGPNRYYLLRGELGNESKVLRRRKGRRGPGITET
jgi:hypothetical protein